MNLKVLLLPLLFLLLFFNNCSDSSDNDDDDADTNNNEDTSTLSLNHECYSCTHSIADGDTCGNELISGSSSKYTFTQSGTTVTLDIEDQIQLTGTYEVGVFTLSNNSIYYRGSDCDMHFEEVTFTAEITTQETIDGGWVGQLSYDLSVDRGDDECDKFSFTSCHAQHQITCTPSSC